MAIVMPPTFVPYDPAIHQNLMKVNSEVTLRLKTTEINELVKILKDILYDKIVKVRGVDGSSLIILKTYISPLFLRVL